MAIKGCLTINRIGFNKDDASLKSINFTSVKELKGIPYINTVIDKRCFNTQGKYLFEKVIFDQKNQIMDKYTVELIVENNIVRKEKTEKELERIRKHREQQKENRKLEIIEFYKDLKEKALQEIKKIDYIPVGDFKLVLTSKKNGGYEERIDNYEYFVFDNKNQFIGFQTNQNGFIKGCDFIKTISNYKNSTNKKINCANDFPIIIINDFNLKFGKKLIKKFNSYKGE